MKGFKSVPNSRSDAFVHEEALHFEDAVASAGEVFLSARYGHLGTEHRARSLRDRWTGQLLCITMKQRHNNRCFKGKSLNELRKQSVSEDRSALGRPRPANLEASGIGIVRGLLMKRHGHDDG
jgi:hypothetical protein